MIAVTMSARLVTNDFGALARKLHDGAAEKVATNAERVQATARGIVSVVTSNLHDHIEVEDETDTRSIVHTGGVPYGLRQEYGFNGADSLGRVYQQAPRPYMTPAAEIVRPQFVADMTEILR